VPRDASGWGHILQRATPCRPAVRPSYPPTPCQSSERHPLRTHRRAPSGGCVRRSLGWTWYRWASAATQRGYEKRAQYQQDEWGTYRFTPPSMETCGRLGAPMMHLLSNIGNLAVSRGNGLFPKEQFVSGVLRELSASLCKTNARLEHGVSSFFVRASGIFHRHGQSRPTAEVSDWD
jgi:hypothetical protein